MKNKTKLIGICGGSGSGKSTLCRFVQEAIEKKLGPGSCQTLAQDHYYIDQSRSFDHDGGAVNFDHPNSLDFSLMAEHLKDLRDCLSVSVPQYDFATHTRKRETRLMSPSPFVLVDGILILSNESVRNQLDRSIFLDIPEALRMERRLNRDVLERGREALGVKRQIENQVKPMHNEFVQPSAIHAQIRLNHTDEVNAFVERLDDWLFLE